MIKKVLKIFSKLLGVSNDCCYFVNGSIFFVIVLICIVVVFVINCFQFVYIW